MQTRHKNGRFGKKTRFINILFFLLVLPSLAGWTLIKTGSPDLLTYEEPKITIQKVLAERAPDRLDKAVAQLRAEVMTRLEKCESGEHVADTDSIFLTFDPPQSLVASCAQSGGKMNPECYSIGTMQMKIPTVRLWTKRLDDKDITEREARAIAEDPKQAREFAERVIFDLPGSIWAWSCSYKKDDTTGETAEEVKAWYQNKIGIIRHLEAL